MKILGRILIILAVFALVMGITYAVVNARGSSGPGTTPGFQPGKEGFSQSNGAQSFPGGGRPAFPGGDRNESRGEHGSAMVVWSDQKYCCDWHHCGLDRGAKRMDGEKEAGSAGRSRIKKSEVSPETLPIFDSDLFQDFFGKRILIFNPAPGSDSAEICPPWAWMIDLAIASPSPEPPSSR